jgi:hypothetical protein
MTASRQNFTTIPLECGDLSPLWWALTRQRLDTRELRFAIAKCGDKSPHTKALTSQRTPKIPRPVLETLSEDGLRYFCLPVLTQRFIRGTLAALYEPA